MYAYIVDNKISEIYPSNEKAGKCIKMPDDYWISETHDYKYDPETDSIVEDLNHGSPVPTQEELDEIILTALRQERDVYLASTDWVVTRAMITGEPEPILEKISTGSQRITKTYKNQNEVVW